jgi:hypothetical protein
MPLGLGQGTETTAIYKDNHITSLPTNPVSIELISTALTGPAPRRYSQSRRLQRAKKVVAIAADCEIPTSPSRYLLFFCCFSAAPSSLG